MKDPPFSFILYWKEILFGRGEILGLPLITRKQHRGKESPPALCQGIISLFYFPFFMFIFVVVFFI